MAAQYMYTFTRKTVPDGRLASANYGTTSLVSLVEGSFPGRSYFFCFMGTQAHVIFRDSPLDQTEQNTLTSLYNSWAPTMPPEN